MIDTSQRICELAPQRDSNINLQRCLPVLSAFLLCHSHLLSASLLQTGQREETSGSTKGISVTHESVASYGKHVTLETKLGECVCSLSSCVCITRLLL